MISELLRASLLGELGDSQDRAARVRGAADDLAVRLLGADRPLVPEMVLVSLDPDGSASGPALTLVAEVVLDRWETFRNAFAGQPTELLRAVGLSAVAVAAGQERSVRDAAWYALRIALEERPVGTWAPVAHRILAEWDGAVRADLSSLWSPSAPATTLRMPKVPTATPVTLQREALRTRAQTIAASGQWQQAASNLARDVEVFTDQLIDGIDSASSHVAKLSNDQLRDFANGLGQRLRETLGAYGASVRASALRNDLLWWRQTGYSERLSRPYADAGAPATVVLCAAVDLRDLVPDVAPVVVEHLLADVVAAAVADAVVTLADLRTSAAESGLEPTGGPPSPLLLGAVRADADAGCSLLASDASMSAIRCAVLVFRELQAERLAVAPPPLPTEADAPDGR